MAGVGVSCDHQPASFVDDTIGRQYVDSSAHFGGAFIQFVRRHIESEQDMLHLPHCRLRRKDAQNVEAQSRCQLKARQHQELAQEPPVFVQAMFFVSAQAIELPQQRQFFDFLVHRPVASHRVVVGEGNDIQSTALGLLQDVKICYARFGKVRGARGMQV